MGEQGSLFSPGSANREEPMQARVLSRRDDPATSKQAAKRKAIRLTESQDRALATLIAYGPGTTHYLAWAATLHDFSGAPDRATAIHHELARRYPELERKLRVRVQQDPSKPCRCKPDAKRCRCRDVVRDGSRVWEVVNQCLDQ